MIVFDASASIDLLLRREPYDEIADLAFASGQSVHAPELLDVEVLQVLRRLEAGGVLSARRAREALADFRELRLTRHGHEPLLGRVWELRKNFGAYDAVYIALAEALDAALVTTDRKLARVPGHRARVQLCGASGPS